MKKAALVVVIIVVVFLISLAALAVIGMRKIYLATASQLPKSADQLKSGQVR